MGLFGKKKVDATPVETTETTTELEQDNEKLDNEIEDTTEMEEDIAEDTAELEEELDDEDTLDENGDGVITGEDILAHLHKGEETIEKLSRVVQGTKVIGFGELAEKISNSTNTSGKMCQIHCFLGASGGVGTTTCVLEIANRLAKKYKVLIIDLNVQGSLYRHFYSPLDTTHIMNKDMLDLVDGRGTVKDCLYLSKSKNISILNCSKRGIDSDVKFDDELTNSGFEKVLTGFKLAFDYILIDCGYDTKNFIVNTTLYNAKHIFIVTDGGLSSLHKLSNHASNFSYCGIAKNKVDIIHNKSSEKLVDSVKDLQFKGKVYTIPYLTSAKHLQLAMKTLDSNDFIFSESALVDKAREVFDTITNDISVKSINTTTEEGEEANE